MLPFGRKYDNWDTYTWTELVLPYIEQKSVYDNFFTLTKGGFTGFPGNRGLGEQWNGPNGPMGDDPRLQMARKTFLVGFYCPSDNTNRVGNEMASPGWSYYRSSYRGCTGSGDMYGNRPSNLSADPVQVWGVGAWGFARSRTSTPRGQCSRPARMNQVTDGTSKTLLLSEGLICHTEPNGTWGGPIGEAWYGNMGGGRFRQPDAEFNRRRLRLRPLPSRRWRYFIPAALYFAHSVSAGIEWRDRRYSGSQHAPGRRQCCHG